MTFYNLGRLFSEAKNHRPKSNNHPSLLKQRMADANVDEDWEELKPFDNDDEITAVAESGSDSDDNEDDDNSFDENTKAKTSQDKIEKRKRKLIELKEAAKRAKITFDENTSAPSQQSLIPWDNSCSSLSTHFDEEDFFKCDTIANEYIKCPFTNAILIGIPKFKAMMKKRNSEIDVRGHPLILIVTMSAIRATEIVASISNRLNCKIAKLFAKHIKIQEQIEYLNRDIYPISIGTPHRLHKLLELGALSLSKTRIVILDTQVDQKQFSLFTLPGVKEDFTILMEKFVADEMTHLKIGCTGAQLTSDSKDASDKILRKKKDRRAQQKHKPSKK